MKFKKSLILFLLIALMALVACGGKNEGTAAEGENASAEEATETTETSGEAVDGSSINVGFVTDEGGLNDQSFNQGVKEGIEKAKADMGIESSYLESKQAADYVPNLETFTDQDKNLIIGAGFKMGDAIIAAAESYPEINYAIVDVDPTAEGTKEAPSNLLGIMFRAQEPSFLVGYIAGMTTETNKVGFVGGLEGNIIWGFEYGYKAGVDYAAKERGVDIEIMSQYVGGFTDAQKGKSIALTMYQNGADVVFHAAGGAGDGVIAAAKDATKDKTMWAIGVDKDQYEVGPDNVLTSAMKNADVAVYNVIKTMAEGKFEGGKTIEFGLADEGAVGIAPTSDKHVKKEILDKIPELTEKIISGEIKVPYNEETYNAMK
ncbi:BMP family lipoprotein [Peptoniphilus raoultii]|uniref:BMP family lipoprotein n=1 Tax=Peptoniphilus raoultii TaxID=1776387 RepID=UPI0008DA1365|nr:BMP family ABC transporter substrate-binding protein [Peptoniphilus raoultii]